MNCREFLSKLTVESSLSGTGQITKRSLDVIPETVDKIKITVDSEELSNW